MANTPGYLLSAVATLSAMMERKREELDTLQYRFDLINDKIDAYEGVDTSEERYEGRTDGNALFYGSEEVEDDEDD